MFDTQILDGTDAPIKGTNLLLVPKDAVIPDDLTMPTFEWTWEGIVAAFSSETLPAILKVDSNDDQLVTSLGRFKEISLKTLQGLPTDYPSHWQITFSALPKIAYQELLLAKDNSKAHNGSGVQPSKQPRAEMKPLDPNLRTKLEGLATEAWNNGDLD